MTDSAGLKGIEHIDDGSSAGSSKTYPPVDLVDDEILSLTDKSAGFAVVMLGATILYRCTFFWGADGSIAYLEYDYSYVAETDEDGKFCIYAAGTQVKLRNRTGGTLTLQRMGFSDK